MSVYCFSRTTSISPPPVSLLKLKPKKRLNFLHLHPNSNCPQNYSSFSSTFTCRLDVSFEDVAAIAQNKILIAAGFSGAIGQFSKPFTSVLLYGKPLNFSALVQAGGFPSTHSSAVVATATSLALERGFADSIFGMALVYASLVMYDAQGVRREVGIHAKTINKLLLEDQLKSQTEENAEDVIDSVQKGLSLSANMRSSSLSEEPNAVITEKRSAPLLLEGSRLEKSSSMLEKESRRRPKSYSVLKESIGHTEVEVLAGAILGFLVSLGVHAIM